MATILYEKTTGALVKTGTRNVNTYASGLCRVDRVYTCATANSATHRYTLRIGAEMPDDDSAPAVDGLYIFPQPQETEKGDGFTEFQVSAYGRTETGAQVTSLDQSTYFIGNPTTTGMYYKVWTVGGTIAIPSGQTIDYEDLGLEDTLKAPFDFQIGNQPTAVNTGVTVLNTVTQSSTIFQASRGNELTTQDLQTALYSRVYRVKRLYEVTFSINDIAQPALTRQVWVYDPKTKITSSRNFGYWNEIDFTSTRDMPAVEEVV